MSGNKDFLKKLKQRDLKNKKIKLRKLERIAKQDFKSLVIGEHSI